MPIFSSNWTLKDVSTEARQAAARAASAQGEDLGVWLTQLIHKASKAELAAAEAQTAGSNGTEDSADTKLTSIERAMLRPDGNGMNGNLGSA